MAKIADIERIPCDHYSFLDLSENLIRDPAYRKPIQRIFALMRRRGAAVLLLHREVQKQADFEKKYRSAKHEMDELAQAWPDASIGLSQLTFFSAAGRPLADQIAAGRKKGPTYDRRDSSDKLLGSCLLMHIESGKTHRDFVFEALIGLPPTEKRSLPPATGISSHVHVCSKATFPVGDYLFDLPCAYYVQKNGLSGSCAHCCVREALWHLRNDQFSVTAGEINQTVRAAFVASERRPAFEPRDGLQIPQILAACDAFDAVAELYNFDSSTERAAGMPNAFELAYMLCESGLPTLILFQSTRNRDDLHVIPVIGHTLSTDEWLPHALAQYTDLPPDIMTGKAGHYISSVEWSPHLVAHDDLMGPYYVIGQRHVTSTPFRSVALPAARPGVAGSAVPAGAAGSGPELVQGDPDTANTVGCVVGVIGVAAKHEAGRLNSPVLAQEVGSLFFWNAIRPQLERLPAPWAGRLKARWPMTKDPVALSRDLVLRTQQIQIQEYIDHLTRAIDHVGKTADLNDQDRRFIHQELLSGCDRGTTNWVWMVEFSLPELFSGNLSKLGEILFPMSYAQKDTALELLRQGETAGLTIGRRPSAIRMISFLDLFDTNGPGKSVGTIPLGFESHTPLFVRTDL